MYCIVYCSSLFFASNQNILFLSAPPATYECYRQTDEDRAFHKALSAKERIKNEFNDGPLGMWCIRHGYTFTASKGHNLPGCAQNCYCCRRQQPGSIRFAAVLLMGYNIFTLSIVTIFSIQNLHLLLRIRMSRHNVWRLDH